MHLKRSFKSINLNIAFGDVRFCRAKLCFALQNLEAIDALPPTGVIDCPRRGQCIAFGDIKKAIDQKLCF